MYNTYFYFYYIKISMLQNNRNINIIKRNYGFNVNCNKIYKRNVKIKCNNTPYNSYDDDEEPNIRMDEISKLKVIEQLNTIYNQQVERMTSEELQELLLNKWKKRHEVTFFIQNNGQLSLCILEICAGDQDYGERINDVVDIINDLHLADIVRDFIANQTIKNIPVDGIVCSFNIYQINAIDSK